MQEKERKNAENMHNKKGDWQGNSPIEGKWRMYL